MSVQALRFSLVQGLHASRACGMWNFYCSEIQLQNKCQCEESNELDLHMLQNLQLKGRTVTKLMGLKGGPEGKNTTNLDFN